VKKCQKKRCDVEEKIGKAKKRKIKDAAQRSKEEKRKEEKHQLRPHQCGHPTHSIMTAKLGHRHEEK
jgi:hypothetical protein